MKEYELKSCPFCGGEAIYKTTSRFSDRNGIEGWIHAECGREVKCMEDYCPNCGARMDGE